jgi:hypothetical protein
MDNKVKEIKQQVLDKRESNEDFLKTLLKTGALGITQGISQGVTQAITNKIVSKTSDGTELIIDSISSLFKKNDKSDDDKVTPPKISNELSTLKQTFIMEQFQEILKKPAATWNDEFEKLLNSQK